MIRAVLDTNVLDSAFRSSRCYSFDVFVALRQNRWRAVLSNHLIHEYEEILKAHAPELGLTLADIDTLLDAICARAEEWQLAAGWLPILADPDDEPLVQLAYDSAARRIVTHNVRHLRPAEEAEGNSGGRLMGEHPRSRDRGLAAARVRSHDSRTMTIQVTLPDSLAAQARELATREHITVDALVASALTAQLDHTPQRPTIAERAARVNWEAVDAILARVPDAPAVPGDER